MSTTLAASTDGESHPDPRHALLRLLTASPHQLLHPTLPQHAAAVVSAKTFLDPLAHSLAKAQELRKRENKRKRKRSDGDAETSSRRLQLRQVYTEGFEIVEIWEQAKRILGFAKEEVERDLDILLSLQVAGHATKRDSAQDPGSVKIMRPSEVGSDVSFGIDERDHDGLLDSKYDTSFNTKESSQRDGGVAQLNGHDTDIPNNDDQSLHERDSTSSKEEEVSQTYVPDRHGLNDGFFSIDDFNNRTQILEQQDGMGENDNPSDEEEVDWDADPLSMPLSSYTKGKEQEMEHSDSEGNDGPTFGNANLNAASDDDEEDDFDVNGGMTGLENTNDITYGDFFDPPPQKSSNSKRMRALPKTQPPPRATTEQGDKDDTDDDLQRAISDVRRDLLDSEDDFSDQDSADRDDTADKDSLGRRIPQRQQTISTHEKQVAKLTSEIRRLESAAVSKRDWTLSGEASASDRPLNSLIAEDLEFERAGKPVPVITAEISEEIEALIKQRIVHREFDEVVRRRPDAVGAASSIKRGRVEIDDSKPSRGLAEIYEAAHLKATDPNYVDKRSTAVKKQHEEIERLWKDVSAKLDTLSNLNFKPKRTEISVQVVSDKPTISMEDARPGGGETEAEIRLAPQEIYTAGEDGKRGGEVLEKAGLARSKEEMTREEKVRMRRRKKSRDKKQMTNRGAASQQQNSEKKGKKADKLLEKRNILDELRKGGVKVIGKGGDMEEIEKRKNRGHRDAEPGSTSYKL